jgi:hypothetical protein
VVWWVQKNKPTEKRKVQVMFSDRSSSNTLEITDTDILGTAPAVFAQAPMPGASNRYTFLPTGQILTAMRQEGWKPVEARQMGVRRLDHSGFQRPMVRFQRRDLADRVAGFRAFNLADALAQDFAQKALALRYDHSDMAPIRAEQLLDVRRGEDAGNSLWAVTNRVRENLLRGGMRDAGRVNRSGKPFRPMRAIRGLGANVQINTGIWQLAESFRSLN